MNQTSYPTPYPVFRSTTTTTALIVCSGNVHVFPRALWPNCQCGAATKILDAFR
jgi:hypothetical protein